MDIVKKKCVCYTRKSVEDAVEKEFNSIDAQREACELFIASQRGNNWVCSDKKYDDYGLSGGNTNRPALQELLKDCEAGLVDIVVVYKVDRLSRSIVDFGELSKKFDKWGVSFVSVTQDINTSTSSGRMMLNILMTFAQYEREVIAERVRDKMAASRKRGQWVGGTVPFGYKVENKKLIVNPQDAIVIKKIFNRFLEIQSSKIIASELNADGIRTRYKKLWYKDHIYRVLNNYTYIGQVNYKGHICEGEQEGIISKEIWDKVQELLANNNPKKDSKGKIETVAPLRGLFYCGHCNGAMIPTYTQKGKRNYHYYVCSKDTKRAESICPIQRVAAGDIEKIILEKISELLQTPEIISQVSEKSGVSSSQIIELFENELLRNMTPAEQNHLVGLLIEKITIWEDSLEFEIKTHGMQIILEENNNDTD